MGLRTARKHVGLRDKLQRGGVRGLGIGVPWLKDLGSLGCRFWLGSRLKA